MSDRINYFNDEDGEISKRIASLTPEEIEAFAQNVSIDIPDAQPVAEPSKLRDRTVSKRSEASSTIKKSEPAYDLGPAPKYDREEIARTIAEARAGRRDKNLIADMGDALSGFASGVAGTKHDSSFFQGLKNEANQDVKDVEGDGEKKRRDVLDYMRSKREGESLNLKREQISATNRLRGELREKKDSEKMELLNTPFGLARTMDDAKQIKQGAELKENFDRKLQEMVDLRTKHNGGAFWNREDVGRGKQLSKDLLLLYKDMAKLGVLSKSDEAILNEIIPTDPLQYNASGLLGQDPTMVKLKSFQTDVQKDFDNRLKTRLRKPEAVPRNPETEKSKPTQFPLEVKKDGKKATVSDENELDEAIREGWK